MEYRHLQEVLERYAVKIEDWLKRYLDNGGITASGTLRDSIKGYVEVNGTEYSVMLDMEKYWKWIDSGRPPTENGGDGSVRERIKEWIEVKNIIPEVRSYTDKNGKTRDYKPTVEQLSYLITRKIHEFGFYDYTQEGVHFMDEIDENFEDAFYNDCWTAIIEDIKEEFDNELSSLM